MGKKINSDYVSKTKQKKMKIYAPKTNETQISSDKISTLAIDSGVFIELFKTNVNSIPDEGTAGFHEDIRCVKRLVMSGHIKLVITPTVLKELMKKLNEQEIQFMFDYCYMAPALKDKEIKLVNILAIAKMYLKRNGVRTKFDKRTKKIKTYNDARALAEASAIGLCFMTVNTWDLINYGKYDDAPNGVREGGRVMVIKAINAEYHFGEDARTTPYPMTPTMFLDEYHSGDYVSDIELERMTDDMIKPTSV